MSDEEIEDLFTYHPPFGDQPERYTRVRATAKVMAMAIRDCCLDSVERDQAFANLRQAVMWANAAIAINEAQA
jgi:hypothetical protein